VRSENSSKGSDKTTAELHNHSASKRALPYTLIGLALLGYALIIAITQEWL
jgi:hypothetical protein